MKVKAFFDEGGDDPRDKLYILAGWVGSDAVWQNFSTDWSSALKASNVAYFKHNEAKGLKKQFAGRSKGDRDKTVASLVEVICAHEIIGLVATFHHRLFEALLDGSAIPRRQLRKMAYGGYTSPYYFCFHLATSQLLRYLVEEEKISTQVDFVFDDRNDVLAPCIKLYGTIRENIPKELRAIAGTATPGNDRISAPLQAADLLAGQVYANVRTGTPEATMKALAGCRKILKCRVEPEDLPRFKATLNVMNAVWKAFGPEAI